MSDNLSGFLLWSEPESVHSAVSRCSRIHKESEAIDGWQLFTYEVSERIPQVNVVGEPPYKHPLHIRLGADRLILLSNDFRICQNFIDRDLRPSLSAVLRRADTAVHDLVVCMINARKVFETAEGLPGPEDGPDPMRDPPSGPSARSQWEAFNRRHLLGYAAARTDAFGGTLERLEFSGEDLVENPLFTNAVPVVRFRSCGLRKRDFDDRGYPTSFELLRIGRMGYLSFQAPSAVDDRRERFKQVEALLRALNRFGFIR
jgi:hypothetical protein